MRSTRYTRDNASTCTDASNESVTRRLPKQTPARVSKRMTIHHDDPIPSTSAGIMHNDFDLNDTDSDQEFIVEDILRRSVDRFGKFAYYIKWKDYSFDECTWEPVENCDCPELIQKFELSIARHVQNRMCIFQGLPEVRASVTSSPDSSLVTKQVSKRASRQKLTKSVQKPINSSQQPRVRSANITKPTPRKTAIKKRQSLLPKGDRQPSPPKSMQIIGGRSLRSRK